MSQHAANLERHADQTTPRTVWPSESTLACIATGTSIANIAVLSLEGIRDPIAMAIVSHATSSTIVRACAHLTARKRIAGVAVRPRRETTLQLRHQIISILGQSQPDLSVRRELHAVWLMLGRPSRSLNRLYTRRNHEVFERHQVDRPACAFAEMDSFMSRCTAVRERVRAAEGEGGWDVLIGMVLDDDAFARELFWTRTMALCHQFARRHGDLSEDLAQDVCLRLFADNSERLRMYFDGQRGSFRSYLAILVRWTMLDRRRRLRRRQDHRNQYIAACEAMGVRTTPMPSASLTAHNLLRYLECTASPAAQAIVLRYRWGYDWETIGATLGMPTGAIRKRAQRMALDIRHVFNAGERGNPLTTPSTTRLASDLRLYNFLSHTEEVVVDAQTAGRILGQPSTAADLAQFLRGAVKRGIVRRAGPGGEIADGCVVRLALDSGTEPPAHVRSREHKHASAYLDHLTSELGLSEQQSAILALALGGMANEAIASTLGISVSTLESHMDMVLELSRAESMAQLRERFRRASEQSGLHSSDLEGDALGEQTAS